jgi:hypothetical protein
MNNASVQEAFASWTDDSDIADANDGFAAAGTLVELLNRDAAGRDAFVDCALLEITIYQAHGHGFPPPPPPKPSPRFGPRPWGGALVLLVATTLALTMWRGDRTRPSAMAPRGQLTATVADATPVLPPGTDVDVPDGRPLRVYLRDGSLIVVEPNTRLRIQPLDDEGHGYRLELRTGSAEFDLIPGCRPFTVVTPFGSAQALGPQFAISVNPAARSMAFDGPMRALEDALPADARHDP